MCNFHLEHIQNQVNGCTQKLLLKAFLFAKSLYTEHMPRTLVAFHQIAYKVRSISIILNCPHNIGEFGIMVAPQICFYKHLNLELFQMAF